jgi:hypothetical protein
MRDWRTLDRALNVGDSDTCAPADVLSEPEGIGVGWVITTGDDVSAGVAITAGACAIAALVVVATPDVGGVAGTATNAAPLMGSRSLALGVLGTDTITISTRVITTTLM